MSVHLKFNLAPEKLPSEKDQKGKDGWKSLFKGELSNFGSVTVEHIACLEEISLQWIFQVPLKGGRWHIIPQLAVYTTYILPSGGLYNPYHLLPEPEKSIDRERNCTAHSMFGGHIPWTSI